MNKRDIGAIENIADQRGPRTAPRYVLTVEASGPDPAIRLRQALKVLLRRFNLRCISIVEVQDGHGGEQRQRQAIRDEANAKRSDVASNRERKPDGTMAESSRGQQMPATGDAHPSRVAIAKAAAVRQPSGEDGTFDRSRTKCPTADQERSGQQMPTTVDEHRDPGGEQRQRQAIRDEANAKRSEAAKDQPRKDGGFGPGDGQQMPATCDAHPTRVAIAKAAAVSPSTVRDAQWLRNHRPDLALQVMEGTLRPRKSRDQAASAVGVSGTDKDPER